MFQTTMLTAEEPAVKFLSKGKKVLTSVELICIMLGNPNKYMDVAREMLRTAGNEQELRKKDFLFFKRFKGVGEMKAIQIAAAFELARRAQLCYIEKKQIIKSKDAKDLFEHLGDLPHEEFHIVLLNKACRLIKTVQISMGGIDGTIVDTRIIFKHAIENYATNIILCHNHPSGNAKPSQADIELTQELVKAGKTMRIMIVDHIIISDSRYYSFADEGLI